VANLPRMGIDNTSTVIAGRAPHAGRCLSALAPRRLTVCAILCALTLAGCASNSAPREPGAEPVRAAADLHRYSALRIRRPDRALLTPQPVPDCELRAPESSKILDPDQLARLRLDYERQCYKRAEALVRNRLKLLQASGSCEIEPVRHSRPAVSAN
jgi:hypothetical protein